MLRGVPLRGKRARLEDGEQGRLSPCPATDRRDAHARRSGVAPPLNSPAFRCIPEFRLARSASPAEFSLGSPERLVLMLLNAYAEINRRQFLSRLIR